MYAVDEVETTDSYLCEVYFQDYGAVDAAATLFEEASSLNFSPSYVLNLIHTYELKQQYKLCMDVALKFCKVV